MAEISSDYVKKELKKVAFFVQHSGLFDKFPERTRNVLENLPIEWENVETSEETQLKWQEEPTWEKAVLVGKLNGKPFTLKIKRDSARNIYTIIYDGKEMPASSLPKLKVTIESLSSGTVPKQKIMKSMYDIIQNKKSEIYQYIKLNYLRDVTERHWNFKIQKDVSRIYLRFYVDLMEEKEGDPILEKLKEEDHWKIDAAGTYVKNLLKKEGITIDDFMFTRKYTRLSNKVGFVLTLK